MVADRSCSAGNTHWQQSVQTHGYRILGVVRFLVVKLPPIVLHVARNHLWGLIEHGRIRDSAFQI